VHFAADFFNVLNMPGLTSPQGDGIVPTNVSGYTNPAHPNYPRHLQFGLRLTW
jgi:hypothetical protein